MTSGYTSTTLEVPMPEHPLASLAHPPTEACLWRRFTERRDLAARDALVDAYMPLARRMASRYAGVSEPYDDLVQVASLGLVKAIDRFDPSRGTPFAGFAKPTILGELKRHFRDRVWTIRVPRGIHDTMARVERATEVLSSELSRPPSVDELSRHLKLDPSAVLEALEAGRNRRPLSLETPVLAEDGGESAPPEWVGGEDPGYQLVEDRLTLETVRPALDPGEREILRLRFIDELPQSRVAERIGCSQMQVSRRLNQTLGRLRRMSEGDSSAHNGGPISHESTHFSR
jgi:RNA polymerase sigma-B factor